MHWWLKGLVEARTEAFPELEGRGELLERAVKQEYDRLKAQYAPLAIDNRSQTHLHLACLALATHKALLPFLRDDAHVVELIGEHLGQKSEPGLSYLMKAVKFLQRDHYATLVRRLRGLRMDYGPSFQGELDEGGGRAVLTFRSCLYADVFAREGVPQLARVACCQVDANWLQAAQYSGVRARLARAISAGDDCCQFEVVRLDN